MDTEHPHPVSMGPVPSLDTPYTGCISFYQDFYSDVVVLPYNFYPSPDFSSLSLPYTDFASPADFTPLSYFDDAYMMGDVDTPSSMADVNTPPTMGVEGLPKSPAASSASPGSEKGKRGVQQVEVLQPAQAMGSPQAVPSPQSMQSPQSLQSPRAIQPPQLVQQQPQMQHHHQQQQQQPLQMVLPSQAVSPALQQQQQQQQPQPPTQPQRFLPQVQQQLPLVDPATLLIPEPSQVMYALDIARESEEGAREPTVCKILDEAVERIWGYVLAAPETYVLTRDQFAVFNYFQGRFEGNPVAVAARVRFWRNYRLK